MKKTALIKVRCTPQQKARIKGLARIYAGGNVSKMTLDWLLQGHPKFVRKPKSKSR